MQPTTSQWPQLIKNHWLECWVWVRLTAGLEPCSFLILSTAYLFFILIDELNSVHYILNIVVIQCNVWPELQVSSHTSCNLLKPHWYSHLRISCVQKLPLLSPPQLYFWRNENKQPRLGGCLYGQRRWLLMHQKISCFPQKSGLEGNSKTLNAKPEYLDAGHTLPQGIDKNKIS